MEAMAQGTCNPLTDPDCDLLNNILQGCAVQAELIRKCVEAGLNVDKYQADNLRRTQLASGVKKSFFPNRP
jgi:hypothetical protein